MAQRNKEARRKCDQLKGGGWGVVQFPLKIKQGHGGLVPLLALPL